MAKMVYPVILTPAEEGGYCVYVPDFDCDTQGDNLADALCMAEDVISLMGIVWQDDGKALPKPSDIAAVEADANDIKTLVTVDFDAYRRKPEKRVIKKTLSVPSWLNAEAESAGINFSATLQDALKSKLGIAES
jgi:predicted RNase H-like HicB family nuclease